MCRLALVVLVGCVSSSSVTCPDGQVCPNGTTCVSIMAAPGLLSSQQVELCASSSELAACRGINDGEPCQNGDVVGTCWTGVCLPAACGNGRLDPALHEVCDDGNQISGDGCSADCLSDETCGNYIVDPVKQVGSADVPNEQCDDGNHVSRDGCSSDCQLETPRWDQVVSGPPPARQGAGAAYDSARDRIVLFGGQSGSTAAGTLRMLDDTWEWDGRAWRASVTPVRPPPRSFAAAAYDATRRVFVVYGGVDLATPLNDTWEWDGSHWSIADSPTFPSAREGAAMTYDPIRQQIVLFGGAYVDPQNQAPIMRFQDTWVWNGTWKQLSPAGAPPARYHHAMAFDPVRGVVVMTSGDSGGLNDDTWTFDGTTWKQADANSPTALFGMTLAWDAKNGGLMAYGGAPASAAVFRWNGSSWSPVDTAAAPGAFSFASSASEPSRGRVLLFGGATSTATETNATWEWDGESWAQARDGSAPPALQGHSVAVDTNHRRAVVFGGALNPTYQNTTNTASNQTWIFESGQWQQVLTSTTPPARWFAAMAYDAANDNFVLFGGINNDEPNEANLDSNDLADTWIFDGTNWSPGPTAPAALTPRRLHAMAYDSSSKKIVLYGGVRIANSGNNPAGYDTWEWDGASRTWNQRVAPASGAPTVQYGETLVYDPELGHVIMIGGVDQSADSLSDTWQWDSTQGVWTRIVLPASPPARHQSAAAWNGARVGVDEFAGVQVYDDGQNHFNISVLEDTWELSGAMSSLTWDPPAVPTSLGPRTTHVMFPGDDGESVILYGGESALGSPSLGDVWQLRWDTGRTYETCATEADLDGDGFKGCKDPDCWATCWPECPPPATPPMPVPPGTPVWPNTCDPSRPHCGDGTCSALETCRICPQDCAPCMAVCGDNFCDPPETAATCPGDCH